MVEGIIQTKGNIKSIRVRASRGILEDGEKEEGHLNIISKGKEEKDVNEGYA